MIARRHLLALALLAASLAGLGTGVRTEAQTSAETIKVVATFSILGDLVRNVGGARVEVVTLVGVDGDAHVYSPTPADARRVADAALVFANGLTFDGWIDRLATSSGGRPRVVEASKGSAPLKGGNGHGHSHAGDLDPHAWQNVANVKLYVSAIRDALVGADPAGRGVYEENAAAYGAKLDALDREIKAAIETIPANRRRVITSHDAFRHFEAAYGLTFIAPQGVSTKAEASAKDVARIVRQIKRERIPAVFLENVSDARLIEQIARETGASIGGQLYSDALSGPGGPAGTFIEMMRHNVRMLSEALAS